MRISDWSSDVCSSDLPPDAADERAEACRVHEGHRRQVDQQVGVAGQATQRLTELVDGVGVELPHRTAKGARSGFLHLDRSEEHTSELQSLIRISYAVFSL